jgi:hypothetical protein
MRQMVGTSGILANHHHLPVIEWVEAKWCGVVSFVWRAEFAKLLPNFVALRVGLVSGGWQLPRDRRSSFLVGRSTSET